jgi:putative ABC transport system substrate-binding protein
VKTGTRQQAVGNSIFVKVFGLHFYVMLFALCSSLEAQQPARIPRIGYLSVRDSAGDAERSKALRLGLRERGYVEGQNIIIEYRYAEGKDDRLPALATELVRLNIDVIVTSGASGTRAAKAVTNTIPIVMTQDPDPIGNGFIASFAEPGGNITGLSNLNRELSGKRLELLKEIVPRLARVAVIGTSNFPGNAQELKETELAAGAFGMKLQYLDVLNPNDIETAFRAVGSGHADAMLVLASPILLSHRQRLVDLALKRRVPTIYNQRLYVEDGGLLTYGVNLNDLARRAATYVDKILKGAKPTDLPVEQPTKFELVVNLKTAKQIGLTIPPNVLARADRVIR